MRSSGAKDGILSISFVVCSNVVYGTLHYVKYKSLFFTQKIERLHFITMVVLRQWKGVSNEYIQVLYLKMKKIASGMIQQFNKFSRDLLSHVWVLIPLQ